VLIIVVVTSAKKDGERAPSPVFLRLTAAQRKRFRLACVEDDVTYAEFVVEALNLRDKRRERRNAVDASPLHSVGRDQ
jgi:ATP-dependent Clp protease adapter protein ClpS